MKVLVIGKPTYNVIIPIFNYLAEGTKNITSEKTELPGGTSVYAATLLARWGLDVSYAGVIGGDASGTAIKTFLDTNKVNTKFLEINYEHKTDNNYIILNKTNGSSTQIAEDNGLTVTKFKYDFTPDVILMDGTDSNGAMAALNNYPRAISILFANKINETYYNLSKRATYVVSTIEFAKALTKMDIDFGKGKTLVSLFQKIKDLNRAEYIVMLKEKGVLYTSNRQVKMLPAVNVKVVDDTNSGSTSYAAYAYGIINKYDQDITAKIANTAAALSLTKIGINALPELSKVLEIAGIKEVSNVEAPTNESEKLQ